MNPNQTQRGNASQKCHNRTCVFLHVWYKYLLDLFVCLFCVSWLPQEWRNWRLPALFSKVCMKRRDVTSPSSPASSSGITKFLICLMVYLFPDFFSWLIHNYCSMRSYRWLSDNSRLHNNLYQRQIDTNIWSCNYNLTWCSNFAWMAFYFSSVAAKTIHNPVITIKLQPVLQSGHYMVDERNVTAPNTVKHFSVTAADTGNFLPLSHNGKVSLPTTNTTLCHIEPLPKRPPLLKGTLGQSHKCHYKIIATDPWTRT